MSQPTPTPVTTALPRGVIILVGMAAAVVTVAGVKAVSGIIGPVFLALMLAVAADPLRTWATRRGLPRWAGTILALVVVYVGLLALCGSLVIALARFAALVPEYQAELGRVLADVQDLLNKFGVGDTQVATMLSDFDLSKVGSVIGSILGAILSLATNIGFVIALVLFICLDADPFVRHLERVRPDRTAFTDAMESFAKGTRRYLVVSTAFGLVVAVIDTTVLWAMGVPAALLWGLLAFITNYIPNIGFILGLIPPAVLALLEGGPGLMLGVIAAYCVINVVIQSIIQPKLVGDAVGISASITFLSLVVWAWILGPLGAVLAVPLTLLVKTLFVDVDPNARWVSGLIGAPLDPRNQPPEEPEAEGAAG
ncbi:AI-2E family transporter [Nocardioides sambongensis]|uniref:AI-2E family transporter n=1 Tax=Nocardioides sambongensis TaxID=2589074 RepID=UPI0011289424|nr:AI-2E family transporter [Nocardioides sambongensis]